VAAQRINGTHNSEASLQRVKNMPGYTTPVFKGKDEQRTLVENAVAEKVGALSRC
jgi:glutamate dehydrogenase